MTKMIKIFTMIMSRNSWTPCTSLPGKLLKTRSSSSSRSTIQTVSLVQFLRFDSGKDTDLEKSLKKEAAAKKRKQLKVKRTWFGQLDRISVTLFDNYVADDCKDFDTDNDDYDDNDDNDDLTQKMMIMR